MWLTKKNTAVAAFRRPPRNRFRPRLEMLEDRTLLSAPSIEWIRQFGTGSVDTASGIAADASGVYVIGRVDGTLPGQSSAGGTFVRKYDANGAEVWTRQFGSSATG